jgi:hypothetical protein
MVAARLKQHIDKSTLLCLLLLRLSLRLPTLLLAIASTKETPDIKILRLLLHHLQQTLLVLLLHLRL